MSTHLRPLLLGHRGAKKYAPENTLAAFDLALAHGCDGFEFDVRYTRDSRCVICHNPHHRRKRIRSRFFDDLQLPSADEVVRTYLPNAYLDIELKVAGDASPILETLNKVPFDRYVISSFLPEVLDAVHEQDARLPLGLICESLRQLRRWPDLPLKAVILNRKLADRVVVGELQDAKRQVLVWTVNKEREMRRLAELGVDGLISDDTKLLASTLK